MKRRMFSSLLALLLLLASGCAYAAAGKQQQESESYALYFLETDMEASAGEGALQTETIYLNDMEDAPAAELAEALMTELLKGPVDETLKSTIPVGTTLLSLEVEGTRAYVDLSLAYSTLSGVALTLADYAITLTLTQIPAILSVKITVRGQELAYRDRQIFTTREVLLAPEEDVVSTVPAVLYFLKDDGELAPEERTLNLYEGDTQVGAVVRALENGPESKELSAVFPEGFRVKSVWLEESVCYVNLSSALLEEFPDETTLRLTVRSLGTSLCSLETVDEVRFLVDGEFTPKYGTADIEDAYTA